MTHNSRTAIQVDNLAQILETCHQLKQLHIHGWKGIILSAISLCRHRVQLTELDLSYTDRSCLHGILLGGALERDVLPELEVLDLGGNRQMGEANGLVGVMDALRDGKCPRLKLQDLSHIVISSVGGAALGEALRFGSKYFAHLETLNLANAILEPQNTTSILTTIRDGACPS